MFHPSFLLTYSFRRVHLLSIFVLVLGFSLFCLAHPRPVFAATRTWDGGGGVDTNWSTDANWSADTEPVSADTVVFDNTSDNNSTIDSTFTGTVTTININSGYDGTITMARSFTTTTFSQAAGSFTAANQTLDINGGFTLSAGTFTASSGTVTLAGAMTISGSPIFNHNSGTVIFDGSTTATLSCNNVTFNLVDFDASPTTTQKSVSSNCSMPLGANPSISRVSLSGTLSGTGTLTLTSNLGLNTTAVLTGFTGLVITSGGTLTVGGATADFSTYTTFNPSGTVTLSSGTLTLPSGADLDGALTISGGTFNAPSSTMTVAGALTISGSPTFNHNNGTITFDGVGGTLSCNNVSFNLVTIAHTSSTKIVSSNCSLPLGSNPSIAANTSVSGTLTGTGTLTAPSNFTLSTGAVLSGFTGLISSGVTISGATIDLSTFTTVTIGSFTLNSGTFTASANMSSSGSFTVNGGVFNHNSGTITLINNSGTWSCNNVNFNLFVLNYTSGTKTFNSNCTIPLGNNPVGLSAGSITLNGTLSGTGTLTLAGTLTLNSGATLSGFSAISLAAITVAGATADFGSYSSFSASGITQLTSGTLTLPSGADLNGNLTISGGTFNAPSGTMTIEKTLTISGSPIFNHNNGTVSYDGITTATLSCNNVTFHLVTFAHSSGTKTVNSDCSLPLGVSPSITRAVTLNGTLSGSGILNASSQGTGSFILNAGATITGFSGITAGSNFQVAGATLDLSSYSPVDIEGGFNLSSGSFTAPSGTMTVAGLWVNSGGTFTHNSGTVVLDGSNQILSGSTTFNNLTKIVTSADTLTFPSSSTQTVVGVLTLKGANSGNLLSLRSSSPGTQWLLDPQGGRNITYVDVKDSRNINATVVLASQSLDLGNNTGWNISNIPAISLILDSPGHNSYISSDRPTFKWKRATPNTNAAITKYSLEVDNGPPTTDGHSFNFGVNDIASSSTTDYEVSKYKIHFDGFGTSDTNDDYISVTTKSSPDWGVDNNDGKVRQGTRTWTVTAYDSAGNQYQEGRTVFVEMTVPILQVNSVMNKSGTGPTVSGTLTDPLSGGSTSSSSSSSSTDSLSSGPQSVVITLDKKNAFGIYTLHTLSTVNVTDLYWSTTKQLITDNSLNLSDKYATFSFTPKPSLPSGIYRITIIGKDRAGNSSVSVVKTMTVNQGAGGIPGEEPLGTSGQGHQEDISSSSIPSPSPSLSLTPSPESGHVSPTPAPYQGTSFDPHGLSYYWGRLWSSIVACITKSWVALASLVNNSFSSLAHLFSPVSPWPSINRSLANLSFTVGEQLQEVSETAGYTVVKLGYRFVDEPTAIADVQVTTLSPTSATISWTTNHPATGKVNYGLDETYPLDVQTTKRTTYHEFTLTNLQPDTEYHFEVMSQNKNYVYDANRRFKTPTH